ncbi:MAG: asparaginase domain-containing protein [Neisseria sp.]|nr:asparaginase domain-containing protein [Neisseria sp.]
MKNIAILYTGGTIGMKAGVHGLTPDADFPARAAPVLQEHLHATWYVSEPLIDSAAVTPQDWAQWIALTEKLLAQYDGVLILHGTDTMAYSATLFASVFAGSLKPIVFCGAQHPWGAPHGDAERNLQAACALFDSDFHGTGIVFADTLFDPADCRKISTERAQGFAAVYRPPLGNYSGEWQLFRQPLSVLPPPSFTSINDQLNIAACTLMPGYSLQTLIRTLEDPRCDAVILHSYGHGNTPDTPEFIAAVRRFCAQDKVLLNLSQVWHGDASARYAQNHALTAAGALNGGQTTPEHALALLSVALSSGLNGQALHSYLRQGLQAA